MKLSGRPPSALLLAMLIASPALARPVLYGGDANFPPYEYLDEAGQPAGLNIELIREVARLEGWELTVKLMAWPALRTELEAGRVDVSAMYRSPAREELMEFAIPHELVSHEMYIRKGDRPVAGLAELRDRAVLVQSGTYADDVLKVLQCCGTLRAFDSEPEALRALARGEGSVAVVTQTVGRPFAGRAELGASIVPTGPPVLLSEYGFVTLKGHRELLELINQGVSQIRARGDFDRIYERWIRPDRSAHLARQAGLALILALLLMGLVIGWNWSLRRRVAAQSAALRLEFEARERVQASLVESERSLRAAQKMEAIGRLSAGVSHDFNNILSVILAFGGFVREDLVEGQRSTEDIDEVLGAAERAARLTRQLLAFSRSAPMTRVRVDLVQIATGMHSLVQRLVTEQIVVRLDAPDEPVWVEAEATLIEQMLLNLAANARDAMPRGGHLTVAIDTRSMAQSPGGLPAGDYARLSVTDDGVGMDEVTRARIFEPFFTTKEEGHGTGLGLSIVFANVQRLGGKVVVDSEVGKGSTFTLLLPRSLASIDVPAVVPLVAGRAQGQTVLLVEDDEPLRRSARVSLTRAGYRVVEASEGREALEAHPPDVLVTDVVMPRMGGAELAAAWRAKKPGLPVLFLSANAGATGIDFAAPTTRFLAKPFTTVALVAAVTRLLAEADERSKAASSGPASSGPAASSPAAGR